VSCLVAMMWKSNSSISSRSSLPIDIVNSENISFEDENTFNFNKWNIHRLSTQGIYIDSSWIKSTFKFKYAVKTVE
jgi:hypothetical protein